MKLLDIPLAELLGAEVEILDLQQGTDEWYAFRRTRYGASDAAAMFGLSPYETRADFLHRTWTGLQREHSDFVQAKVLDRGHAVEAAIRTHIENIVGDDLGPVTCARRGTKLAASCDGLTLLRDTAWECKQWNEDLAALVREGTVPDSHMPQCQQELLVTGAQSLVFSVTDGTPAGTVWCEVKPDQAWFARILRGWQQFEADLQAYEPPAAAAPVVAAAVEQLPAVSVRMDGALDVKSNLPAFGHALKAFVERIPKAPSTDQEFADTEAACKALKRAEDALDAAESGALASIATVEQMRATVGTLRNLARQTRLASEKVVAARKEQLREEIVAEAALAVGKHIAGLEHLHGGYLVMLATTAKAEIGGAIKGLKTLDSIRGTVGTKVAAMKVLATAAAERIAANRTTLAAAGDAAQSLFADRAQLVLKDPEAVTAIVSQRLAEQKAAEERRLERIRAEERARAEAQVAAAAAAATAASTPAPTAAPSAAPIAQPAASSPAAAALPPVKLADLNARLGWTITSAEVQGLGVKVTRDGPRMLIAAADLAALRQAMHARIDAALGGQ